MGTIGRFPRPVVCFCASCNRSWGWGKNEYLGTDFTCPDQPRDEKHVARVVLNEAAAFYWLRIEHFLYAWQTRASPHAILRRWLSWWEAGHSVVLWFILIGIALLCETQYASASRQWSRPIFATILVVRAVDVILANLSITITSRFPANRLRTVVFTLAGYLQIVLAYSYFYAVGGQTWFPTYRAVSQAIYFSFGTVLTVGYGDLKPPGIVARGVVISKLILGLFFVVIVVGQVVAWATQTDPPRGEFSLERVSLRP